MTDQISQQAPGAAIAKAWALLAAERPEEALAELSRLSPEQAASPVTFRLRGHALIQLQRWDEAVANARQGLAEGGPEPTLLRQLGFAFSALGQPVNAERALLDALALSPNDVDVLCGYARLCLDAGQTDKAQRLWERAAALDPRHHAVMMTRVVLALGIADDREAERAGEAFLAEYPADPTALALHGQVAETRGRSGHDSFRQAVAADPTDRDYADLAWETRVRAHPLLVPLRPLYRLGMVKSWLIAVVVMFGLRAVGLTTVAIVATAAWVVLCVYSWVMPPLVRKWVMRHRS